MNVLRHCYLLTAVLLLWMVQPASAAESNAKPSKPVPAKKARKVKPPPAPELKPPVRIALDSPTGSTRHEKIKRLVEQAKEALEDEHLGTSELGGHHAVLALWHPDDVGKGLIIATIRDGKSLTLGIDIEVLRRNGVGSQYAVTPDDLEVLALRTNVTSRNWSEKAWKTVWINPKPRRNKKTKKMVAQKPYKKRVRVTVESYVTEPAVYVPFAGSLQYPEMIADGRAYVRDLALLGRLKALHGKVPSNVYPDRNITEVIPAIGPLALLINEHTDHDEFYDLGVVATTDKVFTVTALNGEDTYDYSGSFAGARGFAQFIKSSYEYTVRDCPKAKLIKDFRQGMQDHVNQVLAMYCYMDGTLSLLNSSQRAWLLRSENEEELVAFLAAAYNGNPLRAARAYTMFPSNWETVQCDNLPRALRRSKLPPCLARETRDFYQPKIHAIYRLLKSMRLQGY